MAGKKKEKNRDLSRFLTSEEGKIVKGDVVKIAVSLGLICGAVQQAAAHSNYFTSASHFSSGTDVSHASHASHGSHGSHGQW